MGKLWLSLFLASCAGGAFACPDAAKAMDAQAPSGQKLVIAPAPARSEVPKAQAAKTGTKPALAAAQPVDAKKPAGS